MSYCAARRDLKLSADEVLSNFAFTGAKIGDQVISRMPAENSQEWFGKTPPDLSLEARAKGPDWVYNYLRVLLYRPVERDRLEQHGLPERLDAESALGVARRAGRPSCGGKAR